MLLALLALGGALYADNDENETRTRAWSLINDNLGALQHVARLYGLRSPDDFQDLLIATHKLVRSYKEGLGANFYQYVLWAAYDVMSGRMKRHGIYIGTSHIRPLVRVRNAMMMPDVNGNLLSQRDALAELEEQGIYLQPHQLAVALSALGGPVAWDDSINAQGRKSVAPRLTAPLSREPEDPGRSPESLLIDQDLGEALQRFIDTMVIDTSMSLSRHGWRGRSMPPHETEEQRRDVMRLIVDGHTSKTNIAREAGVAMHRVEPITARGRRLIGDWYTSMEIGGQPSLYPQWGW